VYDDTDDGEDEDYDNGLFADDPLVEFDLNDERMSADES
jgi:hypothetical protein